MFFSFANALNSPTMASSSLMPSGAVKSVYSGATTGAAGSAGGVAGWATGAAAGAVAGSTGAAAAGTAAGAAVPASAGVLFVPAVGESLLMSFL